MRVNSYEEFFADPITRGRFWWMEEGVQMLLQWASIGETTCCLLAPPRLHRER